MNTSKTAALYARVSSEEQVQGYSIQAQLRAGQDWAEKNGYVVVRKYVDEGYSASRNLEKREAFKEMVSDAASKKHPFDLIIVHKLDRFSRNALESFTSRALLKREKVRLVSVVEPVVGSDAPEDAFMEHILIGMSEFYSKNLSREIMKGLMERVRHGHLIFRPPYGYKKEILERQQGHKRVRTISRPVVDERVAPIVQRIFTFYDQGMGYKVIAQTLNSEGHRTNDGHRFRVRFIARILHNRAYIGILDYNLRQDRGPRQPIIIEGFYPRIIDEQLFNRVQGRIKRQIDDWQNSYAERTNYLLSRLVICDSCGHHYVGSSAKGGKFHYYMCRTYIQKGREACDARLLSKNRLEEAVLEQIQKVILDEENIRKYIELIQQEANKSVATISPEVAAVELALRDTEARLRRWEESLERGLLSLDDAAHRIKEVRNEREALLRRRVALQKKSRSSRKVFPIPTRLMNEFIRAMQTRLREKNIGHKKEFLREIIKEVRINGDKVTLTYKLPITQKTPGSGNDSSGSQEFFVARRIICSKVPHYLRKGFGADFGPIFDPKTLSQGTLGSRRFHAPFSAPF